MPKNSLCRKMGIRKYESGIAVHPEPPGELSTGHRIDLLPRRHQVGKPTGRRVHGLPSREFGDILNRQDPRSGVFLEQLPPEPELNRPAFQRSTARMVIGI